jgi:hypothetical protein
MIIADGRHKKAALISGFFIMRQVSGLFIPDG